MCIRMDVDNVESINPTQNTGGMDQYTFLNYWKVV